MILSILSADVVTKVGEFDGEPRVETAEHDDERKIDAGGRDRGDESENGLVLVAKDHHERDAVDDDADYQRYHQTYLQCEQNDQKRAD